MKEIDAMVDELFQKVCLNMADRVSDHSTIKSYLVEWGQSERERALEEAAKAAEDCAVTWMARAVALPMERDIDPEKAKLAKIAAGQIAHSIRALKGE